MSLNLRLSLLSLLSLLAVTAACDSPPADPAAKLPINEQGRLCSAEIGVIEPFDCLDGEIIPIMVDGKPWSSGDPYPQSCDIPSWLGASNPSWCHPNARVGRLPGLDAQGRPDDDVQNMFICRHYSNTDQHDPCFEDIAIIQHRKSTGATCFFQHEPPDIGDNALEGAKSTCTDGQGPGKKYRRINASRVPPPVETVAETHKSCPDCPTAGQFWMSPIATAKVGCNRCHASGPYIRSPYISQVSITVNGRSEPVVYPLSSNAANNYDFVGTAFTDTWEKPEYIGNLNFCTSCHVMGTGQLSFRLVAFSVGQLTPPEDMPDVCSTFYPPVSAFGRRYPHSHWMPPAGSDGLTLEEWNNLYGESVKQLMACLPARLEIEGKVVDLAQCLPAGFAGQTQNCPTTPFGSPGTAPAR